MKRRSTRLIKKLHKRWLECAIDLSQDSIWRQRLFGSVEHQIFEISSQNTIGLPEPFAVAIRKYGLKFSVRTASPEEAEAWLSENGMVLFKFWATSHPSL